MNKHIQDKLREKLRKEIKKMLEDYQPLAENYNLSHSLVSVVLPFIQKGKEDGKREAQMNYQARNPQYLQNKSKDVSNLSKGE